MKNFTAKHLLFTAMLTLFANALFAQNGSAGIERYGLYIGSNDGGKKTAASFVRGNRRNRLPKHYDRDWWHFKIKRNSAP